MTERTGERPAFSITVLGWDLLEDDLETLAGRIARPFRVGTAALEIHKDFRRQIDRNFTSRLQGQWPPPIVTGKQRL